MSESKEAIITFGKNQLTLQISGSLKGIESKDEKTAFLNLSTPQFRAQPESKVEVRWLENYQGKKSVEADIQREGHAVDVKEAKMNNGSLYYWMTPTFGSSNYYYFAPATDSKIAVRIGPVAGTLESSVSFNWESAIWSVRG